MELTAKEKARELVDKMTGFTIEDCIINARTCVDFILTEVDWYALPGMKNEYFEEVKEELNKLL